VVEDNPTNMRLTRSILTSSGFLEHDTLMAGCSLDGHVGDFEGLVEIKCPQAATHLDYLKTGTIPGDYYKQITHALWITGAQWCDWLSFNPDRKWRLLWNRMGTGIR